jgi:hypothetical protein
MGENASDFASGSSYGFPPEPCGNDKQRANLTAQREV